jgi:hypothetical protein
MAATCVRICRDESFSTLQTGVSDHDYGPFCIGPPVNCILTFMVNWMKKRTCAVVALCAAAAMLTACGTSTQGSRYNMQHGVSDSGYPPKGSGNNPGSPAISSMGGDVNEKGIEREPVKTPPQNIPSNLASTPRT